MKEQIEAVLTKYIPSSIFCLHCEQEIDVEFAWDYMVKELEALIRESKVENASTVEKEVD